ncbi:anti-adapter protein IraP [Pantoea sp. Bo_2]|uniref:Anti-adapter protein IraP n=1 Tax=Candidatus Pantoea gossypiicola TaxID=2608008 RepID=A0AB34CH79_9GAMM|nr:MULTISPECIES: anti-adapter protein IraP [Pantoea]KAA5928592.1 anti-adapter protein IraP [Pantoea sp. VH_8]KAA5933813.1 anti-adapter protein IraP [Pantoea sp. VH_4]KAA5944989.1 anti-adapter protein IraP [Pantoea sp. VH_3]KAA5954849.1 anti-adapter protein IraP [Pantoea sp. VH_24]KAA5957003.1 anti-adapter protein IraP [Pantoea sp. VH_25]
MKNLIAELLIKLAEKEATAKEQVAQIEALEIVVTALVRKLDPPQHLEMTTTIETAMDNVADADNDDVRLLRNYIEKLLRHPRQ